MPGFHVTVGYLPYRFRPSSISQQYRTFCRERADALGQVEPEWIEGSLMLCSTPAQKLERYELTIRETPWTVPHCDWGSEVAYGGPIVDCARFLPIQLPPAGGSMVATERPHHVREAACRSLFWALQGAVLFQQLSGRCAVPGNLYLHVCVAPNEFQRCATPGCIGFLVRRRRLLCPLQRRLRAVRRLRPL